MKKLLLTLCCASTLFACSGSKTGGVISGQLDSLNVKQLYACIVNDDFTALARMDTIAITNGQFTYHFTDSVARIITIMPDRSEKSEGQVLGAVELLFCPGEQVHITGTLANPTFSGSKFITEYNEIDSKVKPMFEKLDEKYQELIKQGAPQDSISKAYLADYNSVMKGVQDIVRDFLNSHQDEAGVYLAAKYMGPEMLDFYAKLPEKIKNGPLRSFINTTTIRAQQDKETKDAANKIKEGNIAPDFTLKDQNGKDVTLSSLYNKGKYTMLDFWGTWCIWCMKGIPSMQELYKTNTNKLEILSIDCNDKAEDWKYFIKNNNVPWTHVADTAEQVVAQYGIQSFPTKILLDPNGKIIKISVGEEPNFYKEITDIIK